MKAFVLYIVLSVALAIGVTGCAHQKLNSAKTARTAATAALIVGVIVLAGSYSCGDCNVSPSSDPSTARR